MADGSEREWSGDEWCTPPEIWERALRVFNVLCVFDPFPNADSSVPVMHDWRAVEGLESSDGFVRTWADIGEPQCFVNPPFSRAGDAVRKCVEEWMAGCEIVAVIPTSLNSSHWDLVDEAPAVCRPFRRVSFMRDGRQVKGNRQDVAIIYWGVDIYRFRAAFKDYGRVRFG